ncbi:hypothetical protein FEM48_Zijuj11G0137200 [Ziziphus jujuba var. spinosa]|uniref:DUF4220 domain-containing protein n=1 Tax=Ziziphus jujuba var. spinosa TaxID=714518 RepID=A0A978UJ84_ZIZJJ|nr:hypothetical protein FEM48_Zijuj11G0135800 [Ziziphus jujuba var. spinosa]KAH7514879.1 hypothetical protein FEM48_Zijuj11G0137200 [Ziziphus jujuba var. spinosa]
MELPIPSKLEKLWDLWDIPTCILLSLFLQVFLVLFASFRQRSKNSFLLFLIWSAYLSADWKAAVTVGLITKFLTEPFHDPHVNEDLYAFWASFLLLHLGGPDTITLFALEDSEFWLRHLFGLILQVMGAGYGIFLTLPNNNLLLPTILVFVVGSVKYAERTMALYLASLDKFEDRVGDFEYPNAQPEGESFKVIIWGYPLSYKLVGGSTKLFLQIKDPILPIPKKLEKLWDKWDIPACVLLSLLLQVFLVLFASLRRQSRNPVLLFLIWSAYLVADWIAAVTTGLITKFQTQNGRHGNSQDLYAFWASFLLLHLGGPDSITSFALEDNEF